MANMVFGALNTQNSRKWKPI